MSESVGSKNSKKKKTIIIIILSGLLLFLGGFWLNNSPPQTPPPSDNKDNEEIKSLKSELTSLKNELSKLQNNTKKDQLQSQVSNLENKVKNLTNQDKQTIQNLEKEIKEIKEKIENNNPGDDNGRDDEKEIKVEFVSEGGVGSNEDNFLFYDTSKSEELTVIYISKKHPLMKKLSSQGKLQKQKKFIIYYKKPSRERYFYLWFDENNKDLKIEEV
jgi:TolA-binding protein